MNVGVLSKEVTPNVSPTRATVSVSWLVRLEWCVFALIATTAIALHFRLALFVGSLWRDEVNSLNLATLPSISDIGRFLDYDSFPALFFGVLRAWTDLFGTSDDVLRLFGLTIGLGILGVLIANARTFGARLPLLSIALLGLNPMLIRYGDSVRAYGLGILLILLTFGAFWRLVDLGATKRRIAMATICAVFSVQCIYYNSILLFAIASGAIVVAARRRDWRTATIVLVIGVVAAISLAPYSIVVARMRDWTFMVQHPVDLAFFWKRANEVIGSPRREVAWLWIALFVGGTILAATVGILAFSRRRSVPKIPSAVLFALVALVIGVAGYAGFLRLLKYYTQPWYYMTLAAFVAAGIEILFGGWQNRFVFLRVLRPVLALALLCLAARSAWKQMPIRHTNADLVAARLESISQPGDLILVPRWEFAITLRHYYQGPAEIITMPPIEDHRFHRYDLVLEQMKTPEAYRPVLAKMEQTLRSGHRVYVGGELPLPDRAEKLPMLPPFDPNNKSVTPPYKYNTTWQLHAAQFLANHALKFGTLSLTVPGYDDVQEYERLHLGAAEGWRE